MYLYMYVYGLGKRERERSTRLTMNKCALRLAVVQCCCTFVARATSTSSYVSNHDETVRALSLPQESSFREMTVSPAEIILTLYHYFSAAWIAAIVRYLCAVARGKVSLIYILLLLISDRKQSFGDYYISEISKLNQECIIIMTDRLIFFKKL